jgi:zinc D-Ala-D-Ala dipeptidase
MSQHLFFFVLLILQALQPELFSQQVHPKAPELRRLDLALPEILIDLRYATSNNFTRKTIYPTNIAWLRPETIECLKAVQKTLRRQGFQIVILDAYRPAWAQQKLWDSFPDANFVAPPKQGSRHTRGTTVDVTLATLKGDLVEMPSAFDEFSLRADHDFSDVSENKRRNGSVLRKAMFANGFQGVPAEWWHYDLKNWNKYPFITEK